MIFDINTKITIIFLLKRTPKARQAVYNKTSNERQMREVKCQSINANIYCIGSTINKCSIFPSCLILDLALFCTVRNLALYKVLKERLTAFLCPFSRGGSIFSFFDVTTLTVAGPNSVRVKFHMYIYQSCHYH